MKSDIIAKADELSETIGKTDHGHALRHAVRDFVDLLTVVPDYPATEFSTDEIGALRARAEEVIARIEQRVSTTDDSATAQLELVGAVYEIRKRLEQIDQWRRHFLGHS